jgi:thioredoxin reductase
VGGRGQPLAQIGLHGGLARTVERALLLSRWSRDVILLTQGEELNDEQAVRLQRAGVAVDARELVDVARTVNQLTLTLTDGTALKRRAVFVSPGQRQQSDLAQRLGCRVRDAAQAEAVEVGALGRTSVAGIWSAGTTAQPALLGIAAAGVASMVAVAAHGALLEEELVADD